MPQQTWQLGWKSTRVEARALAGLQFVRRPLVQQGRGFCGPNPLGRCHPLAAASGVPPNPADDMVFLSVKTPTKTKAVGAGQASDLCWIEAALR